MSAARGEEALADEEPLEMATAGPAQPLGDDEGGEVDRAGDGGGDHEAGDEPGDDSGSDPDALARLAAGIESLGDRLGHVEKRVDELQRLGERNARHVDDLHAENQRLRGGEIAGAVAPMVRDLIGLHDNLVKLDFTPNDDIDMALRCVLGVLGRWGVEPYAPAVGDRFDPARQHGVRRIETDGSQDATVARVCRHGFVAEGGRLVRPADVEVYRRQPAPDVADRDPGTETPSPGGQ